MNVDAFEYTLAEVAGVVLKQLMEISVEKLYSLHMVEEMPFFLKTLRELILYALSLVNYDCDAIRAAMALCSSCAPPILPSMVN